MAFEGLFGGQSEKIKTQTILFEGIFDKQVEEPVIEKPKSRFNLFGITREISKPKIVTFAEFLGGGQVIRGEITKKLKEEARRISTKEKERIRGGTYQETLAEVNHIISVARGGTRGKVNLNALETNLTFLQSFQRLFGKKFEVGDFTDEQRQEGRVAIEKKLDKDVKAGRISNDEAIVKLKGWDFIRDLKPTKVDIAKGVPRQFVGLSFRFVKSMAEATGLLFEQIDRLGKTFATQIGAIPILATTGALGLIGKLENEQVADITKNYFQYIEDTAKGDKDFIHDSGKRIARADTPLPIKIMALTGLGASQFGNPAYFIPIERVIGPLAKVLLAKKIKIPVSSATIKRELGRVPGGEVISESLRKEIAKYPNKRELLEAGKRGEVIGIETKARVKIAEPFVKPEVKIQVGKTIKEIQATLKTTPTSVSRAIKEEALKVKPVITPTIKAEVKPIVKPIKVIEKPIPKVEPTPPVKPLIKEKFSLHYERIKQELGLTGEGIAIDTKINKEVARKSYDYIQRNPEKAMRIAYRMEEAPATQNAQAIAISIKEALRSAGKIEQADALDRIVSQRFTSIAQELNLAKMDLANLGKRPIVQMITSKRLEKIGNRLGEPKPDEAIEVAKKKIKKETSELKDEVVKTEAEIAKANLKELDKIINSIIC